MTTLLLCQEHLQYLTTKLELTKEYLEENEGSFPALGLEKLKDLAVSLDQRGQEIRNEAAALMQLLG